MRRKPESDRAPLSAPPLPATLREPPNPPPRLSRAIRSEIASDLRKVTSLSRRSRIAASLAAFSVLAVSFSIVKWGDDIHQTSRAAVLGAMGWALVVLAILLLGFSRFGVASRRLLFLVVAAVPLAFFAYLAVLSSSVLPFATFLRGAAHVESAQACGFVALGIGGLCTAAVLLVWRRTDPFNPGLGGALLGLVGGIAGATSVGLVCPDTEGWHLWIGHGLSVVAMCAGAAAIGRRWLAP